MGTGYRYWAGLWIHHFSSIRIHKVIESGSNTNPDPQQNFWKHVFLKFYKSKLNVNYRYSTSFEFDVPVFLTFLFSKFKILLKSTFFPYFVAPGSGFNFRIRIHKVNESGSGSGYRKSLILADHLLTYSLTQCCGSETIFFPDPDPIFLWVLDPDPVPDPTINIHSFTMPTILHFFHGILKHPFQ
jgi:hypothetical protein